MSFTKCILLLILGLQLIRNFLIIPLDFRHVILTKHPRTQWLALHFRNKMTLFGETVLITFSLKLHVSLS